MFMSAAGRRPMAASPKLIAVNFLLSKTVIDGYRMYDPCANNTATTYIECCL